MNQLDLNNYPFAIYSDVHADEESFRRILDLTPKLTKHRISLGDVIGYGQNHAECTDLEKRMCDIALRGDHEEAVLNPQLENDFSAAARESTDEARKRMGASHVSYLSAKQIIHRNDGFVFSHGSLRNPLMDYVRTDEDAKAMFNEFGFKIAFVGHSHVPGVFEMTGGAVKPYNIPYESGIQRFDLKDDSRYIIVVPSVTPGREGYKNPGFVTYNPRTKVLNFIFYVA